MNTKTTKYSPKGINRDVNAEKHPFQYLYSASNIRFMTTSEQITGGMAFEKGNELVLDIPDVTISRDNNTITLSNGDVYSYTNGTEIDSDTSIPLTSTTQQIIGYTVTRDSVVLFTTDDAGMDIVWTVSNTDYSITLKYLRNLGFSTSSPIQAIFNYENENIQKIYWVNGEQQIRFLNLEYESIDGNEPLLDMPATSANFVGVIDFSQPTITDVVGGGTHTAGMIQYTYNLFRLNSSQTKIAPLSEIIPLDKGDGLGGGDLDDVVGAAPIVQIDDIDTTYTHIKVYAIKYTSLDATPSVSLIEEREIDGTSVTVYDDGTIISSLSLEEFLFLGSDPYIPQHIETKDSNLFLFNVQSKAFTMPTEFDGRAYSFNSLGIAIVYDNVAANTNGIPNGTAVSVSTSNYTLEETHDAVNLFPDAFKYQSDGSTLGGEGKYLSYEIVTNPTLDDDVDNYRFFKSREFYRIGIQFYNQLGQTSLPHWVADFKAPGENLSGEYNTLKVSLNLDFYSWLTSYAFDSEDDVPVGYKIIRANRTDADKTILCQGMLSGMMVNSIRDSEGANLYSTSVKRTDSDVKVKLPNILTRTFETIDPLLANSHLQAMQINGGGNDTEIQYDASERKADTYQYTAMYQMYSPEIEFDSVSTNGATEITVPGGITNTDNSYWGREIVVSTENIDVEGKVLNGISPHGSGGTNVDINGSVTNLMDRGLVSDTNGSDADQNIEQNQWYREFKGLVTGTSVTREIYGSPEFTTRGQGAVTYNNNSKYEYSNSLVGFLSDGEDDFDDDGSLERAIISINSFGGNCITFVADDGTQSDSTSYLRPKLEDIYQSTGISDTDIVLLGEFTRPQYDVFLGGVYGGTSYEDKKRTEYLEIGEYNDIYTTNVQINSPGDTYVQQYNFIRISPADSENITIGVNQISELVSIELETTVDLKNRNDYSTSAWDSNFQPSYVDYTNYNTVYSQQPTLITTTDADYTFREIENFDTRIQATATKIPNESIDSWTDVQSDEILDLDGKYGPINGVVNFRDQIYTFQDNAFALIGINPRVQTQGTDGSSIELGTGSKLYDYQYISTTSGSLNKWGILATGSAIYYLDGLNKRFHRFSKQLEPLSEMKGLHKYLENNLDITSLRADNPLLGTGVSMGYDQKNNDVYLTYNNEWTLGYNELLNEFTGFYSYNAPVYIWNKEKFLTVNPNNITSLYETHAGDYNMFYDENQPSSIIMILNPEADHECVFNNLEWKSEAIDSDGTDNNYTWEEVRIWNEFQDSETVTISKIRKMNRKYRLALPRNANSRDRIRNNWAYVELSGNNEDGYFYVNHDIILYYMPNYIIIQ